MRLFGLLVAFLAIGLTGCVTTKNKTSMDQLQTRIGELEQKLEEKDAELVDLKYEVKDLASQVETTKSSDSMPMAASTGPSVSVSTNDGAIKVGASAIDVQTALKNAGFYSGKIDGKVGSGTKKAIQSFQKSRNLAADGVVGKKTWEQLQTFL